MHPYCSVWNVAAKLTQTLNNNKNIKLNSSAKQGVRQYRAANQDIKQGMKKAKMNRIEEQCQDTEDSMKKINSKKAYQLVKDLTSTKQGRTTIIQDKDGKCLTEEQDIL